VVACPVGGSPSTLGHHSDTARACALSPDGSLLASGGDDRAVNVWRVASGELAARLQLDGQLFDCGWMPDGSHLVGVGTRGVYFLCFVDA
jgi:WD40 repeat protein